MPENTFKDITNAGNFNTYDLFRWPMRRSTSYNDYEIVRRCTFALILMCAANKCSWNIWRSNDCAAAVVVVEMHGAIACLVAVSPLTVHAFTGTTDWQPYIRLPDALFARCSYVWVVISSCCCFFPLLLCLDRVQQFLFSLLFCCFHSCSHYLREDVAS